MIPLRLQILMQNLQDFRKSGYQKNLFEMKVAKGSWKKRERKPEKVVKEEMQPEKEEWNMDEELDEILKLIRTERTDEQHEML